VRKISQIGKTTYNLNQIGLIISHPNDEKYYIKVLLYE